MEAREIRSERGTLGRDDCAEGLKYAWLRRSLTQRHGPALDKQSPEGGAGARLIRQCSPCASTPLSGSPASAW